MNLFQFIDYLMNLLFLGLVKASCILINEWISSKNKKLSIYKHILNIVYDTVPSMKLHCCKLVDVEARWVSDSYLAYCRLIKWIYHSVAMSKNGINNHVHDVSVTEVNMMIGSLFSMVVDIMGKELHIKN